MYTILRRLMKMTLFFFFFFVIVMIRYDKEKELEINLIRNRNFCTTIFFFNIQAIKNIVLFAGIISLFEMKKEKGNPNFERI